MIVAQNAWSTHTQTPGKVRGVGPRLFLKSDAGSEMFGVRLAKVAHAK